MEEEVTSHHGGGLLSLLGLVENPGNVDARRAFEREANGRCLSCSAHLDPFEGATSICPACGKSNIRVDLLDFYTRSPAWVGTERSLGRAWLVAVGVVWLWFLRETWFMTYNIRVFAFGCAGLAIATWIGLQLTRLVTRRRISFDPAVALPAMVLAISVIPVVYGILLVRAEGLPIALGLLLLVALPAALVRVAVIQTGRFRRRRLRALWDAADRAAEEALPRRSR